MKKKGMHDFDRLCEVDRSDCATISVGIFEWVETKNGKDLRRGKSKVRVRGPVEKWDTINSRAENIVKMLDAGEYTGPKMVNL